MNGKVEPLSQPWGPIPPSTPAESFVVDHRGLPLVYRQWGDPTLPMLVLQHGGKDHGRSMDWLVAALVEQYCCIVPDLRGHGDSGWVPGGGYDILDLTADYSAVVAHAQARLGQEAFVALGHSLGGVISLIFAAAYPEKVSKFVNIEGLGMSQDGYDRLAETPPSKRWRALLKRRASITPGERRAYASVDEATTRLAAVHETLPRDMVAHLTAHGVVERESGFEWKHDPLLTFISVRPGHPSDYMSLYERLTMPMLLLYGRKSFMTVPEADDPRLSKMADVTLEVIEEGGHWLHHQFADLVANRIRTFLEGG